MLAEAAYLLRTIPGGGRAVLELLDRGVVEVPFRLQEYAPFVSKLIVKYANLPMSLADGCLVRMAEIHDDGVVMTLDHDFRIDRKHGRNIIPTIMPGELEKPPDTLAAPVVEGPARLERVMNCLLIRTQIQVARWFRERDIRIDSET